MTVLSSYNRSIKSAAPERVVAGFDFRKFLLQGIIESFSCLSLILIIAVGTAEAIPVPRSAAGEILVRLKGFSGTRGQKESQQSLQKVFGQRKLQIQKLFTFRRARRGVQAGGEVYRISVKDPVSGKALNSLLGRLRDNPAVLWAEPNYIVRTFSFPDDPFFSTSGSWGQPYSDLWALKKIKAVEAWQYSTGAGVKVAVIDTGVDYFHPDIASNIWINPGEIPDNGVDDDGNGYIDDLNGYDFVTCEDQGQLSCRSPKAADRDPFDSSGHGTHVAGIIGAVANNGKGIAGVAPEVTIIPVRAIGKDGNGTVADLAAAILYAVDNGADIINASWGGPFNSNLLKEVFDYAEEQGVLAVTAAGNSGDSINEIEPARFASVITVAATTTNDRLSDFSNYSSFPVYGPTVPTVVDISAPGGGDDSGEKSLSSKANILSLRASGTDLFAGVAGYSEGEFIQSDSAGPEYFRSYGTSMAAPQVSGVAALVLANLKKTSSDRKKNLTETKARVLLSAKPFSTLPEDSLGNAVYAGRGIVDAFSAITAKPSPFLQITADAIEELAGNGNFIPEANEEVEIVLTLQSLFEQTNSITGKLITTGEAPVTLLNSDTTFTAAPEKGTFTNSSDAFRLRIGNISGMTPVSFRLQLEIESDSGRYSQIAELTLYFGVRKISVSAFAPPEYPLDYTEVSLEAPKLSGNRLVWTDNRNGNSDIYLFDFLQGKEQLLSLDKQGHSHPGAQHHPDISGNTAVWEDRSGPYSRLMAFDLNKNEESILSVPPGFSNYHMLLPGIDGNKISYLVSKKATAAATDLFFSNHYREPAELIASGIEVYSPPALSGRSLLFEDSSTGSLVFINDIHRTDVQLYPGPAGGVSFVPELEKGIAVYSATDVSGTRIYIERPGRVKSRRLLDKSSAVQTLPDISGRHVVWQDGRSNNWNIYYRNLDGKKSEKISNDNSLSHTLPAISETYIAWLSGPVLWARQVPGALSPAEKGLIPGIYPAGNLKPAFDVSRARRRKRSLLLKLELDSEAAAGVTNCQARFYGALPGEFAAGLSSHLLSTVPVSPGMERFRIRRMPGIRTRAKKKNLFHAAELAVLIICNNGQTGLSSVRPVRASGKLRRKVSGHKWLKILANRLQQITARRS